MGAGWVSPSRDPREAAMKTGTSPEAVLCAASGFATSSSAVGLQASDFTFLSSWLFSEGVGLQDSIVFYDCNVISIG